MLIFMKITDILDSVKTELENTFFRLQLGIKLDSLIILMMKMYLMISQFTVKLLNIRVILIYFWRTQSTCILVQAKIRSKK